ALDVSTYRLPKSIGGYHVAIDGAQAITFTAGIGENSAPFRARVLDRLGVLGIKYDEALNAARTDEPRLISPEDSSIAIAVVPTDEEMAIAQETVHLVKQTKAWGQGASA